jgi:hypothetical protein
MFNNWTNVWFHIFNHNQNGLLYVDILLEMFIVYDVTQLTFILDKLKDIW